MEGDFSAWTCETECCGGCCKQVWRSSWDCDAEEWLTPTLYSSTDNQECLDDIAWHIPDGQCYAETTLYIDGSVCEVDPDPPAAPILGAPGGVCCLEPAPCDVCCDFNPYTAQLDIPADWGVFFIDRGFANPSIKCEAPCNPPNACTPATCNPCNDVTARTVVFDLSTVIPDSCAAGYDPLCVPAGAHGANCAFDRVSWSDSYTCCGKTAFGGNTSQTAPVAWCADFYIAKHADDASCRLYLRLRQHINVALGFTGERGSRVYASEPIGDDCCGEFTLSSTTTRSGTALGCSTGSLCDSMPTSLTVTLTCA